MSENLNEILKNADGLKEVPPVDGKDPTLKTYVRCIKTDANGNPVYRTEFVSAMFLPSDHRPNVREDFPSSGSTSTNYVKTHLDARTGDERGHLIFNALGGPPVSHNLVPQPASINRNVNQVHTNGDWYKNEREMRDYVSNGNGFIRFEVCVLYADNNSGRPTAFQWTTVYYDNSGVKTRSSLDRVDVPN